MAVQDKHSSRKLTPLDMDRFWHPLVQPAFAHPEVMLSPEQQASELMEVHVKCWYTCFAALNMTNCMLWKQAFCSYP